ncbi:hypothetical protein HA461_15115 [Rhizobium leguminosarum bv. trifolii]|uniref:hypothetical protein n=1 Tax=Rhizobium leguminosarum TaxID=384 RepID=UPI00140FCB0E|nr:hypothetical protein [Rhizobium leguminosarum]QIO52424.1 hypothetical protein HA461_15115 [Rhizobium leguminosarum bv. trifolii]
MGSPATARRIMQTSESALSAYRCDDEELEELEELLEAAGDIYGNIKFLVETLKMPVNNPAANFRAG